MRTRRSAACLLSLLCLAVSACGTDAARPDLARSSDAPEDAAPRAGRSFSTRTAMGIAAAGGTPQSGPACPEAPEPQAANTVTIAWSSPDLTELASIGVETLVLDEPSLMVEAYINEVNGLGGINGNCFRLVTYSWRLSDRDGSFREVCTDLVEDQPLVLLSLWTNITTLRCVTLGAKVPTMGVHTSLPSASVEAAEGSLFLGDGSVEYLLSAALKVAAGAGVVAGDDRIGLLVTEGANAESEVATAQTVSERLGLQIVVLARVPAEFGAAGVAEAESRVRLLEGGLTDAEIEEGLRQLSRLSPERAGILREMEQYYLAAVESFRAAGVTTVASSASAADVRRLMRAAERLGWLPRWVISDAQPAVLTLAGAPQQQSRELVQVSSRRAAGDSVADSDRACVSLRNTATEAPLFTHRQHTDAWNLITETCDLLDIVFAAMTLATEPVTRESLVAALETIEHETAHGSLVTFAPGDRNGADRFRLLRADPGCVLNPWGCMRAESGWYSPAS